MEQGLVNPHPSQAFESDILIEREADWFATNLLMPEKKFIKTAKKQAPGFKGILALSDKFRTSITSTAIRYIKIFRPNSAIFLWRGGKSAWCQTSEDWHSTIFRGGKVSVPPRGSATSELVANPGLGEILTRGTVLSEWKNRLRPGAFNNDILVEEVMSLGRHGVITLLYPDG